MVHCGRAVLPGAPPSSHGCGRLLQLDIQLSCRNELPQTSGKQSSCLKTVSIHLDFIIFVLALPPHNIFRLEFFMIHLSDLNIRFSEMIVYQSGILTLISILLRNCVALGSSSSSLPSSSSFSSSPSLKSLRQGARPSRR